MAWEWLAIAGDAGSALGGVTVAGAGIGFLLRRRTQRRTDRVVLAQKIAGVCRSTNALQWEFEQWVKDPHAVQTDGLRFKWTSAIAPLTDLEALTYDPKLQKTAYELQDMTAALTVRMVTIGNHFSTRHPILSHFRRVDLHLMMYKHILLTSLDDPARVIHSYVSPLMTWEEAVHEGMELELGKGRGWLNNG